MLRGIGTSKGIGIGKALIIHKCKNAVSRVKIKDTEAEVDKFNEAVEKFIQETNELVDKLSQKLNGDDKNALVLKNQEYLIRDPEFTSGVISAITNDKLNAEAAVEDTCEMLKNIFLSFNNDTMTQRVADIEDMKQRLIAIMQGQKHIDLTNLSMEDAFKKAVNYIYSWVHSRFNEVFDDMPGSVDTYDNERPGYKVSLEYDNENLYFKEITTHLDSKVANRLWISVATIKKDGDRLLFDVSNEYAEPADKYRDNENVLFSRPNFYGEIADNIGICDVERLRQNVRGIDNKEEYNTLKDLIKDDNRQFPVVVFVASDDYWVEKFDVDYFAYLVGYYAHIKRITTDELSEQFAKDYDLDEDEFMDSITVFYPGREPNTSYKSHILNTTFEVIKIEKRKYWNENGCRAFRRQLVSDIRENNVIM